MRKRWFVIGALLAALAIGTGCTDAPDDSAYLNTVTAAGNGKALSAPDTAEFTFGVETTDPAAKPALDKASATADAISSAIQKAGVAADDIQTSGVRIEPVYEEWREGQAPRVVSYRAIVSLRARVRDMAIMGAVIEAATGAGANTITGPTFTLEDDDTASDAAIADAVEDARRRAQAMAEASNKSVGEVVRIFETNVDVPFPDYGTRAEAADMSVKAIEPGQLDVTAQVTVIFSLK